MPDRDIICVVEQNLRDREVFNRILSCSGYLVKDYEDASALLHELASVEASCAIVDVRLRDIHVPSLASELVRIRPDIPCVIAASSGDIPLAMEAMKAGAVDFIEKPVDAETLLHSLRQAIEHRPRRTGSLSNPLRSCLIERLTPRERDVLDLLVQGYQNKMVAYELGISQRTVEVYRARVMRKLDVSNFAELVRVTLEERLAASHSIDPRPAGR